MKECGKCGAIKPLSEFYARFSVVGASLGVIKTCKVCKIKQVQERLKERQGK